MDLIETLGSMNRHPWEISRTKQLIQQCIRLIENVEGDELRICDIGSGDRYFDSQLISSLNARGVKSILHAVDCNYQNLDSISDHIQLHNDISTIENNQMDLIIMMDVLEHIEDDSDFMHKAVRLLKEDGTILITVPAHSNLFSSHDMLLKHYRRYDFAKLELLMRNSHLNVEKCHFFYSSLFYIRWLQVRLLSYDCIEYGSRPIDIILLLLLWVTPALDLILLSPTYVHICPFILMALIICAVSRTKKASTGNKSFLPISCHFTAQL